MLPWIKFVICSIALVYCGYKLSYLGDVISEKTHITKTIMGFVLLAIATSAPEFITSSASILVVKSPDLAAGDIFGSILIDLGIISILDLVEGKGPIMLKVQTQHILYAAWTVILLSFICFSMLLNIFKGVGFVLFGMGLDSFILIVLFVIALFTIFSMEKNNKGNVSNSQKIYQDIELKTSVLKFLFYFFIIIGLGIWLSKIGKEIVIFMGWSDALVGTFFLGVVTSFPELIVSISALRFNINMAVANILGSCFFDIMIVPLCDAFFREGAFLSHISIENLFTVILSIILFNIIIVGIICRSRRSFLKLGWDAIAIIVTLAGGGLIIALALR